MCFSNRYGQIFIITTATPHFFISLLISQILKTQKQTSVHCPNACFYWIYDNVVHLVVSHLSFFWVGINYPFWLYLMKLNFILAHAIKSSGSNNGYYCCFSFNDGTLIVCIFFARKQRILFFPTFFVLFSVWNFKATEKTSFSASTYACNGQRCLLFSVHRDMRSI